MGGGAAPCSALSLAARDIAELRYIRYASRRRGVAVGHIVYTAAHYMKLCRFRYNINNLNLNFMTALWIKRFF
jgi:hypothetical protein